MLSVIKESTFTNKDNDVLFSIILCLLLFFLPVIAEFFHVHIYHISNHLGRGKHRTSGKKTAQKIKTIVLEKSVLTIKYLLSAMTNGLWDLCSLENTEKAMVKLEYE